MTECVLQSSAACLPITALASIQVEGIALLLVGQGPCLHIYDLNGIRVSTTLVFTSQPVLGIKAVLDEANRNTGDFLLITIWGGRLLRLGRITLERQATDSHYAISNPDLAEQQTCPDWISATTSVGNSVFVLTAHNQILEMLTSFGNTEFGSEGGRISTINGPKSFLYSGCLTFAGPDLMIVASGTVFGEILVWTCLRREGEKQWTPFLRHNFQGHKGSVFGVSISDVLELAGTRKRLLASCSDDRTLRIWDISDCDQQVWEAPCAITSTETGFGSINQAGQTHIASAWGHLSRIWDVEFVSQGTCSTDQAISLLSRGEDGACQLWTVEFRVDLDAETGLAASLKPQASDRHHKGKNAWSMCQLNDEQGMLVHTGGADGQILSRRFDLSNANNLGALTVSVSFKDITGSSKTLRTYSLLSPSECLATTDQGRLFRLSLINWKLYWFQLHAALPNGGLTSCSVEDLRLTLIAHQRGGLFALLDGQDNLVLVSCNIDDGISWMKAAGKHSADFRSPTICIVAVLNNQEAVILWINVNQGSIQARQTALGLPDTFTITACCYHQSSGVLLLGSRAGALAIYSDFTPDLRTAQDAYCLRHAHATDTVTSISILADDVDVNNDMGCINVLTTGRDGSYAIHQLQWSSADQVEPLVSVIHLSSPLFGPNIEGAYFSANPSHEDHLDLILYGFRSNRFVVWNETQQSEVLSVECGGAHRTWCYKNCSAFVAGKNSKTFVWTKAGTFNWHNAHGSSHEVIQGGGHGREIKAVARSSIPFTRADTKRAGRLLVATGAEDTNICLFTVPMAGESADLDRSRQLQPYNNTDFEAVATLKGHTTGLQHLHFSPLGELLFSSAGCEELYVWKLTFGVPCIGLGTVLWDIMPKEEKDSDARIMSFDLRDGDNSGYTLAMAYSNGKTKIVRYTPSSTRDEGTFELIQEINYGSFCLMQAFFILPSSISPFEPLQNQTRILSAGTNGQLYVSHLDCHPGTNMSVLVSNTEFQLPVEVHKVHQSSILAMDIMCLTPATHLIATGGDDNALGLTMMTFPIKPPLGPKDEARTRQYRHDVQSILIPNAHAAALTALKIMKLESRGAGVSALVITVSHDQRVKVWRVAVNLQEVLSRPSEKADNDKLFEALQVKLVGIAWTRVADVSGIELIDEDAEHGGRGHQAGEERGRGKRLLVVGVGLELLSIKWGD